MTEYNNITKRCAACKKLLSLDSFHRNKSTKDGYAAYCKECCLPVNREARKIANAKLRKQKDNLMALGKKQCSKCGEKIAGGAWEPNTSAGRSITRRVTRIAEGLKEDF